MSATEIKKIKERLDNIENQLKRIDATIIANMETNEINSAKIATEIEQKLQQIVERFEGLYAQIHHSINAKLRIVMDQMKEECRVVAEHYLRDRIAQLQQMR